MQPWVNPVATEIPGDSISPATPLPPRPSPGGGLAQNGLAQRCDTRPPTRKAPLAAATSIAACGKSGQRGSAWTSARVGRWVSIHAACRRGRSDPGSSVAEKIWKLSVGRAAVIATAAGSSNISSSAEQTPSAYPADPGADPSAFGEGADQVGLDRGSRLGEVEYPEISPLGRWDLGDALRDKADRVSGCHGSSKSCGS